MKITVILRGVLLITVGVASSWAEADNGVEPHHPGEGLDAAGYPTNRTDLSRMSEGKSMSSIAERGLDCLHKGMPTESCNIAGGYCVNNRKDCTGAITHRACRTKGCMCCMPHLLSDCYPHESCSSADGYCIKKDADCHGVVDMFGCRGKDCKCCLPSGFDLPWVYLGNDSFVPFQEPEYEMDWYNAQALCRSYGLNLYHPHDILGVSEYLDINTSADGYWLGAKGDDGINQFWFNGDGLTWGDPWYLPYTYYNNGTNDCLGFITSYGKYEHGAVLFAGLDSCDGRTNLNPLCG